MSTREYIINEVNILPEGVLEKIQDFIRYQKFSLGIYENDTVGSDQDYLTSIPQMDAILKEGLTTPLSECISLSEVQNGVRG